MHTARQLHWAKPARASGSSGADASVAPSTAAASAGPGPGSGAAGAAAASSREQPDWALIASQSPTSSLETAPGEGEPTFQESYYEWRWGSRIRYYTAGDSGPVLLLVHGFGVGGYHFERNFALLSKRFRVYALDLLGQGGSWPSTHPQVEPDPELGPLMYSVETWTVQLAEFLRDKAGVAPGRPAYVAGNSLGGYLAVNLAAQRPDLVKGLALLNATPFWSFRSQGQAPGLWEGAGLDGTVPVPKNVKSLIERLWWRNLSSPSTVTSLLSLVYANPVDDEALLARILEATEHPAAIDAFASIVLSPTPRSSFDENIGRLRCPVLLCYGKADPWVVPLWGQRFKRAVPHAAYYELDNVGHCPHHEAPNSVNHVLSEWIAAAEEQLEGLAGSAAAASSSGGGGGGGSWGGGDPLLVDGPLRVGESLTMREARGAEVIISHVEGAPRNVFERTDAAVWGAGRKLREALGLQ